MNQSQYVAALEETLARWANFKGFLHRQTTRCAKLLWRYY